MLFPSFFNAGPATYEIEQSLRFSTDEYLTRTNSTAATDGQYGTLSVWYKMDSTTASSQLRTIIEGQNGTYGHMFRFYTGKTDLHVGVWGSVDGGAYSAADFRDDSAWYHFLWQFDKTQSGVTNVNKLWVNGVAQSQTSAGNFSSQNWGITNNGNNVRIGHYQGNGSTQYARLKGYIAEMHVVDGALKSATDFGEYDDNGVWRPIPYTGTYGNNGFYLKFDPSATNGIGHDHSGNGNNFTANNFITSGTGTDVMSDTPTTNWATLNPVGSTAASQCSNGNLEYYNGTTSSWRSGVSSFAVSSGKWYFEAKFTNFPASSAAFVGIGPDTVQWVNNLSHFGQGSASGSYGYYSSNGNIYFNGSGSSYGATYSTNDVIGCALDLDAGTLRFYKNGVDQGQAASGLTGTWNVGVSSLDTPAIVNFGQRAFEQTVPTGYSALNTSNLPAPTVKDGADYFNTVLYTGNGSTQSITGVGFQPDWVWTKKRNGAQDHFLYDVVRGSTNGNFYELRSSSQSAEGVPSTASSGLTSLDSDGFSIGSDGSVNTNNDTYVAWNWDAGGSGSSNTDGSITSTVSANPSAGFSVVTWNGSTANDTVGHGLGVEPSLIIFKRRNATTSWPVYHSTISPSNFVALNETSSSSSSGTLFGSTPTAPTSTVFSVGDNGGTNYGTMVAYCFAEVEGYSKFGSYIGNGLTDGPFVYCGFKPAMVIIKNTSAAANWIIRDSARSPYNKVHPSLYPNTSDAEINNFDMDFLSNGFKMKDDNIVFNTSGSTYIFIALASNPFGGEGVSPATAR